MMSGRKAGAPVEKKDSKKKKLTKAEKAQAALEKSADELRRSGAKFDYFLKRIEKWLEKNHEPLLQLCTAFDVEREGGITYEEFKTCLFDLGSPCNKVESQLLCTLLDSTRQEVIEYNTMQESFKRVRKCELQYEYMDLKPTIVPTQRQFDHCPTCKLPVWDGNTDPHLPRYVELELKLVTFEGTKSHPSHLTLLAHVRMTIQGVMDHIREQTALLSTKLAIFRDKSRSVEAMLHPHSTLEDLGFEGGPEHEPQEVQLYYDYVVEFTDCPLLMCDHYF